MALANTGRSDRTARYEGRSGEGAADTPSSFDQATRGRVQLVCDFVNGEVARWRNQLIAVGAVCLVGLVIFPIVTRIVDARIGVIIVLGIFGFWGFRAHRELAQSYRKIATKRLVAATNKALTHKPTSSLTREQFASLDLFPDVGPGFRSAHEIGGHAGGSTYSLHAVHVPGTKRGTVVFSGAIIRLEFSTMFPGHTVVIPEGQGASAGSDVKRDMVLLKNPDFERMFSAYSSDYMPARQLFSPALMELLIAATESFGPDIRLAFLRRSLFVAVPNVTFLPDVTLLSAPLTPEEATGQIVRLSAFAESLAQAVGSS